jgi:3-methyladenine DNA glycosylase AlkD
MAFRPRAAQVAPAHLRRHLRPCGGARQLVARPVRLAVDEVINKLRESGSAETRRTYARHGVNGPAYGVPYSVLDRLARKIKTDHELAGKLWATANHDARILATKIADPEQSIAWIADCDNYVITDAVAALVARSPAGPAVAAGWRDQPGEWVAAAGWSATAGLAMGRKLSDGQASLLLEQIRREIHGRANRVRYEMNNALIAIGATYDVLSQQTQAVAMEIGKVEVDHGETGCKTPDAATYINKILSRRTPRK